MGRFCMKDSSDKRHEPEMAGNVDHLLPSARRDDPSYRRTPVTKYLFAKP
jgi:hypothetical protein